MKQIRRNFGRSFLLLAGISFLFSCLSACSLLLEEKDEEKMTQENTDDEKNTNTKAFMKKERLGNEKRINK